MRSSLFGVVARVVSFQTTALKPRIPPAFHYRLSSSSSSSSQGGRVATILHSVDSSSSAEFSASSMSEAAAKKPQRRPRQNNKARTNAGGSDDIAKHASASVEGAPRPKRHKTPKDNGVAKPETTHDVLMAEPASETAAAAETQQFANSTQMMFADLTISAETKKSIAEIFKYQTMTQVQAETLPVILNGTDCLAKAKTGTGKTLGFLIPAIEQLIKARDKLDRNDIGCLILSPTRELAGQIHKEVELLTTFHNMKSLCCVGGTNINRDMAILKNSIQIMVATPGRLLDHLENGGLTKRLGNMQILIMDEADMLLDMGFRPDMEKILRLLQPSKKQRQTLLFSATVPPTVSEIANIALKPNYSFVDTVRGDVEQTHKHVMQELVVAPQDMQIHAIEALLAKETPADKPFKAILFFTTARLTGFMAELFKSVQSDLGYPTFEIHSRMSQPARQKASDAFRASTRAVLFSSDVSARGMDYPDVTYVLQVGLTERAQYIHRLGRTARAGKEGKGTLLLAPYEEKWMTKELNDMPLVRLPFVPPENSTLDKAMKNVARDKNLKLSASQAYRAWLGFYNGHYKKLNWDKNELVDTANQWAKDVGLRDQPTIERKTVGKMGLKGVRNLLIE